MTVADEDAAARTFSCPPEVVTAPALELTVAALAWGIPGSSARRSIAADKNEMNFLISVTSFSLDLAYMRCNYIIKVPF